MSLKTSNDTTSLDIELHQVTVTPQVSHRVILPSGFDFREYAYMYTDTGRKEHYQQQARIVAIFNEKMTNAAEKKIQEEETLREATEVLPDIQDLNQRLTTVEIRLGLREEEEEEAERRRYMGVVRWWALLASVIIVTILHFCFRVM